MGKIMILNGSPRAPKSNSKHFAAYFQAASPLPTDYMELTRKNHAELSERLNGYSDLLLVFPLYADALPVGLLNFLKYLEENPPARKPTLSVLINCGFLEYQQNDIAVRMVQLFCRRNGYPFGSVLKLGGGEAVLKTPFTGRVKRAVRQLANSIALKRYTELHTTMPISKRFFQWAATIYWTLYGRKYGVTRKQMQTMEIEA